MDRHSSQRRVKGGDRQGFSAQMDCAEVFCVICGARGQLDHRVA